MNFNSTDEINAYVKNENYSNPKNPKICFGFSFSSNKLNDFNYSINYFVQNNGGGSKNAPDSKFNSKSDFQLVPDISNYNLWIQNSYFNLMKIFNDIILQNVTSNTNAKIDFGVLAQNYTTFKADDKGILFASIMPFFLVIAYLSPLIILVSRIIQEKVIN